jgi:alpha-tubulin suppressor-like RCC1 family protein
MTALTRRQALELLLSAPAGTSVVTAVRAHAVAGARTLAATGAASAAQSAAVLAQTRATARHRIVLGTGHGLLVDPDGSVYIWHKGRVGVRLAAVLGLGGSGSLPPHTLAKIPSLSGVVAAQAASACSFVVRGDGTVLAWGVNAGTGKLGTTPLSVLEAQASWGPDADVPVPLAVGLDALEVSSISEHTLVLTRDGRVFAWGTNDKGQLGIGTMPVIKFRTRSPSAMTYVPFPAEVTGLTGVAGVSAGYTHSLAVLKDGTVRAWGENRWGEVGDGTTTARHAPTPVAGVKDAVAVAAGRNVSAALLRDGTVMTWGNRVGGALGRTPDNANRADGTAALVPGVKGIRRIAAGGTHFLGLTDVGTVVSWGMPDFGALGRAGASNPAPAVIPGLASVQSIAARDDTSAAVLASGRIMIWGNDLRPWTRPPEEGSYDNISHRPILLWLDGLEQP